MRLRALRIRFGLSQRELARRAGVTNGAVSMIELGQVSPTVGSLQKLALVMSMTLAQFFAADVSRAEPSFFRASDLLEIGGDGVSLRLVPPGVAASELQMLRERYAPGTGTGETLLSHEGEKAGVVVAGRICIQVGGRKAELGPGDAYHFDGLIPHRFRNVGTVDCELISVATPRRV
ncbi:MAG: transcriptional regulator with XRE-family HTH domain [Bradymonadia bacterium]|jgi:transcriptional regulator with XRE-family HTH domain